MYNPEGFFVAYSTDDEYRQCLINVFQQNGESPERSAGRSRFPGDDRRESEGNGGGDGSAAYCGDSEGNEMLDAGNNDYDGANDFFENMSRGLDHVFQSTKDISEFHNLYIAAAARLMSENPETGLAVMFSYDYFVEFHAILMNLFQGREWKKDLTNLHQKVTSPR